LEQYRALSCWKSRPSALNGNLAAEGQGEKRAGKVQKKVGQIEKVFEK
jgi:hypothetical protein